MKCTQVIFPSRIATSIFLMSPHFPCSPGCRKQVERRADRRPLEVLHCQPRMFWSHFCLHVGAERAVQMRREGRGCGQTRARWALTGVWADTGLVGAHGGVGRHGLWWALTGPGGRSWGVWADTGLVGAHGGVGRHGLGGRSRGCGQTRGLVGAHGGVGRHGPGGHSRGCGQTRALVGTHRP